MYFDVQIVPRFDEKVCFEDILLTLSILFFYPIFWLLWLRRGDVIKTGNIYLIDYGRVWLFYYYYIALNLLF